MPEPSPHDVVHAALLAHLPPEHDTTTSRADLIVRALQANGILPIPGQPLTDTQAESDARALAAASGHPRYGTENGWERILQSPADVTVALTAAQQRWTAASAHDDLARLAQRLLTWHDARRASTGTTP